MVVVKEGWEENQEWWERFSRELKRTLRELPPHKAHSHSLYFLISYFLLFTFSFTFPSPKKVWAETKGQGASKAS